MAQESQLANRVVTSTALPYRSNISPIESDPCYIVGSTNVLTNISGFCSRRPGFSDTVETGTPTVFNNLQRQFTWNRFDGTFITMACDIIGYQSLVYKMVSGQDNNYVLIFTDSGSDAPFDFAVSNNTVYFSNGHVAKKYDPVNGVSNWGIAIGSVNNASGPNAPSTAADGGEHGGTAIWANPNNIKVEDGNFVTVTRPAIGGSINSLSATGFGFAIAGSTTITGIQVDVKGLTDFNGSVQLVLLKAGVPIGIVKTVTLPGANGFVSAGGPADLWGATWTPNDGNQTTFGVQFGGSGFGIPFGGVSQTTSIDFVRITVFGIGGPSIVVSGAAGALSATVGYQYVFTYGNSNSGHISSPSPPSASTAIFTNKLNVQVTLTASTDPQVNQIHVYRSTDSITTGSIAGVYFELPNSPVNNANQTLNDLADDLSLNVNSIAPTPGANDPPTPGMNPIYFAGRIWLFKNNQVTFSDLEECIAGVPEESFQSGIAGNFWTFDQGTQALATAGTGVNQGLMVLCAGRIYGITGNSLDTFRRFLVTDRRGARNIKSVSTLGGMVAWRDTSGQVWISDGNSMQEISQDIRPDLTPYVPGSDSITFHTSGLFHLILVSTGTQIFPFDMDLGQWMPPWTFSCNQLHSGEISPGSYKVLAATSSNALMMNETGQVGTFNDDGSLYQVIIKTQLFSLVPDYGKRFSYASLGLYNEPGKTGWMTRVQIDTNNNVVADLLICVDDDPTNPATVYKSLAQNHTTPQKAYNRGQGKNLIQNIYTANKEVEGRWFSVKIESETADDDFKLYDFFASYKGMGGR